MQPHAKHNYSKSSCPKPFASSRDPPFSPQTRAIALDAGWVVAFFPAYTTWWCVTSISCVLSTDGFNCLSWARRHPSNHSSQGEFDLKYGQGEILLPPLRHPQHVILCLAVSNPTESNTFLKLTKRRRRTSLHYLAHSSSRRFRRKIWSAVL